jgi:hypothetical protein
MKTRTLRRPQFAAALAASVLVAGFAIATHTARAQACGDVSDLLTRNDLMAPVQPADCATVLHAAPEFTWPLVSGASAYTIALTFPDGHTEARSTKGNWFAWDRPVPSGRYQWRVMVAGRGNDAGATRSFVVERAFPG